VNTYAGDWYVNGWPNFVLNTLWVTFDSGAYWVEAGDDTGYAWQGSNPAIWVNNPNYYWGNKRPCCGFWAFAWAVASLPFNIQIWSPYNPPNNWWYVYVGGYTATGTNEDWAWSNRMATGLETTDSSNTDAFQMDNLQWESLTQGDWHTGWQNSYPSNATILYKGPVSTTNICAWWYQPYTAVWGYQNEGASCSAGASAALSTSAGMFAPHTPSSSTPAGSPPDDTQLRTIATQVAAGMGEQSPTGIVRVADVDEQKVVSTIAHEGSMSSTSGRSVDVVTESGNFTGTTLSKPDGSPTPTGTQLTLVIDANTGQVIGIGLNSVPPDLSQLGPVTALG
jgi:hypothetical protein